MIISELINSQDLEFHVSSFLALLSTVVYRNTYNEAFSVPVYSYINNSGLGKLPAAFVKRSFTFDSNRNPTLEELSRSIEFTLESSDSEKTTINNDDTVGIIVVVSEKPLSQERIDAAKTLHQLTKSELTCIVTNTDKLVEIFF